jgi:hypothetical protein
MSKPRFPGIAVRLVNEDGNAYAILGRTISAMREANVPQKEIAKFMREATRGDYDNLLVTVTRWVDVR